LMFLGRRRPSRKPSHTMFLNSETQSHVLISSKNTYTSWLRDSSAVATAMGARMNSTISRSVIPPCTLRTNRLARMKLISAVLPHPVSPMIITGIP